MGWPILPRPTNPIPIFLFLSFSWMLNSYRPQPARAPLWKSGIAPSHPPHLNSCLLEWRGTMNRRDFMRKATYGTGLAASYNLLPGFAAGGAIPEQDMQPSESQKSDAAGLPLVTSP